MAKKSSVSGEQLLAGLPAVERGEDQRVERAGEVALGAVDVVAQVERRRRVGLGLGQRSRAVAEERAQARRGREADARSALARVRDRAAEQRARPGRSARRRRARTARRDVDLARRWRRQWGGRRPRARARASSAARSAGPGGDHAPRTRAAVRSRRRSSVVAPAPAGGSARAHRRAAGRGLSEMYAQLISSASSCLGELARRASPRSAIASRSTSMACVESPRELEVAREADDDRRALASVAAEADRLAEVSAAPTRGRAGPRPWRARRGRGRVAPPPEARRARGRGSGRPSAGRRAHGRGGRPRAAPPRPIHRRPRGAQDELRGDLLGRSRRERAAACRAGVALGSHACREVVVDRREDDRVHEGEPSSSRVSTSARHSASSARRPPPRRGRRAPPRRPASAPSPSSATERASSGAARRKARQPPQHDGARSSRGPARAPSRPRPPSRAGACRGPRAAARRRGTGCPPVVSWQAAQNASAARASTGVAHPAAHRGP